MEAPTVALSVDRLQRRDEVVGQQRSRGLHAGSARHIGDEVVTIVGENAPTWWAARV